MQILYSEIGDKKSLKCRSRKINQNQQLIQINVEDNDIQVIDQANGMVIVSEPSNDEVVVTEQVHLSAHTTHEKPSAGQGPAFNYIANVKKLNLKKFRIFFQIFHFFQ